tara:strand:+ start:50497 stop:51342 length:846 start_codon:yes stop_codon:yes gene_type:complete
MNHLDINFQFLAEAFKLVILGIIQGLTEFLPISSTAHLMTIPGLLGIEEPNLSVIASLQLGSIIAVFIYFWKDLINIAKGFTFIFKSQGTIHKNTILANSIIVGNIPIILIGIFIKFIWSDYESSSLRSIPVIGSVSIFMALILLFSERYGRKNRSFNEINIKDAFYIGASQVLALIPGVSRSGITISTSLLCGLDRTSSARFSFLLGIPAITLAGIVEFNSALIKSSDQSIFILIGILSSAITSWLSIDLLIKFLKRSSTIIFVYYRLFFGTIILANYFL